MKGTGRGYRSARCDGCGLPCFLCVCAELPNVVVRTRITFLVHYREWRKPTNTARLAQRMLPQSRVLLRGGPTPGAGQDTALALDLLEANDAVVLYPSADAMPLSELGPSPHRQLVVPDGTWAQSRRLVRRHSVLQRLTHVRLDDRDTHYCLRRGTEAGLLCTLEAVAWALAALEPTAQSELLLRGFESWQARALTYRGIPRADCAR